MTLATFIIFFFLRRRMPFLDSHSHSPSLIVASTTATIFTHFSRIPRRYNRNVASAEQQQQRLGIPGCVYTLAPERIKYGHCRMREGGRREGGSEEKVVCTCAHGAPHVDSYHCSGRDNAIACEGSLLHFLSLRSG